MLCWGPCSGLCCRRWAPVLQHHVMNCWTVPMFGAKEKQSSHEVVLERDANTWPGRAWERCDVSGHFFHCRFASDWTFQQNPSCQTTAVPLSNVQKLLSLLELMDLLKCGCFFLSPVADAQLLLHSIPPPDRFRSSCVVSGFT